MQFWLARIVKRFGQKLAGRGAVLVGTVVVATIIAAVVTFAGGLASTGLASSGPTTKEVGFTELMSLADGGDVASVRIDRDHVQLTLQNGNLLTGVVADEATRHDLVKRFSDAGVPLEFVSEQDSVLVQALSAATPVLLICLAFAIFAVTRRKSAKGHFALATASGSPTRFDDVAGMNEVKEALRETVEFLRDPTRFGRLGGRAPRGVLLTGEPGTGKTLLARAVSNEAGVPFLRCSGSSFQEMYVGVGASRVRSLFKEARRLAPCIVFIDEIDAVGRARGKAGDSQSSENDQTINQLLVEMDGFDHTSGIVVMASTNRPDVLDPAILRPGRFDRQVAVPLPDQAGRKEILGVHSKPIGLHPEVDLGQIARQTPGFSGAELANLLNEAAILAAREDAEAVATTHIDRARDVIIMGTERKGVLIDPEERYITAVHEAGHVAVGVAARQTDPVHKVSILPRGRALGVTASVPEKERLMYTKEYLEDQICLMLGGRAAEMVILGTMTAGASDDIDRATNIARKMVAELGMSDIGPICLKGTTPLPHSEKLLDRVEETTRQILQTQLDRACDIVGTRRNEIDRLVRELLDRDTLNREEILACFPDDRKEPTPPLRHHLHVA